MVVPNRMQLQVAGVVVFYMSAALVMVFVNKAVLKSSPDLPLVFLFVQLVMAVLLLHATALVTSKVEIPAMDLAVAKKLLPVVSVNAIGLVFNTLCLRDVEASFFQIARGMQLPLTILVSSWHLHQIPTKRVLVAACVVTAGFFVGITPTRSLPRDATPSGLSLFYGVISSLMIAIHAVLIKSSLPHCQNSTIQLAYWTNIGSAVMLAPFVIFHGEITKVVDLYATPSWDGNTFVWGSLVTGLFGFLLCVAGLLSIKVTSPTSHMFSSAARSVLQTALGVLIFHDILTINRAASILTILVGTLWYTWIKSTESRQQPPSRPVDLEAMNTPKHNEEEAVVLFSAPEKDVTDRD